MVEKELDKEGMLTGTGYDSVAFGRDPGEGGPMRENIIVAQIESQSWWGGLLGLSPEPIKYVKPLS